MNSNWAGADPAAARITRREYPPLPAPCAYGQAALVDLQRQYLRWFDHWLKGVDNGVDKEDPVYIYVMNGDGWRGLAALGFGHIEVGTVTPLPQPAS